MARAGEVNGRAEQASGADPVQETVTWALLQLQKRKGFVSNADLTQLAESRGWPLYQLEEVVSFFPHFRREAAPKCEVHICRDMACHHRGAGEMIRELTQEFAGNSAVKIRPVSCLGRCDRAPAAVLEINEDSSAADHEHHAPPAFHDRTSTELAAIVRQVLDGGHPESDSDATFAPSTIKQWKIDPYKVPANRYGAIQNLQKMFFRLGGELQGTIDEFDLIGKLKFANLRGMGGAGEAAASKWSTVADQKVTPKYIVCNADESEPLTFKDREILLQKPHLVIEGMILAGLVCGADRGYIYLRHEYVEQADALNAAIKEAERLRVCGPDILTGFSFHLSVFMSPGGYICGEQSALIEAMEGHRAQPRNKPPDLKSNGLFDKPTLVSNVETFAWVPGIAVESNDDPSNAAGEPTAAVTRFETAANRNWYASLGYQFDELGYRGARLFSICGDVEKPGVYELPIGAPLRDLLNAAGGVIGGESELRALATSGPSGGFLPPKLKDKKSVDRFLDRLVSDRDKLKPTEASSPGKDVLGKIEAVRGDLRSRPGDTRKLRDLQDLYVQFVDAPRKLKRLDAWLRVLWPNKDVRPTEIDVLATPLDIDMFRSLANISPDIMLGAGLAIFAGRSVDLLGLSVNATEFFSRESCGKCVPCRVGSGRLVEFGHAMLEGKLTGSALDSTREIVQQLNTVMKATSICGLGCVAPAPLVTMLTHFPDAATSRKPA